MSFSMLEMRIVIREMLRTYELQPAGDGHEPPSRRSITVMPGRGGRVRLATRARATVAA
jgi:hypothetical protein